MAGSALRRSLDGWFDQTGVAPAIVAEFDDSALLKAFGEAGASLLSAPHVVEQELRHSYHVLPIGDAAPVKETFYAISPDRVVKQAEVREITEAARESMSGRA